jgi:hypothetical protein
LLPPITINNNTKRVKKPVVTRPLPESGVSQLSQFMWTHAWGEVLEEKDLNRKVEKFHQTLRHKLDEFLPEKTVMISYLDKKWMTPQLKTLNRKIKREFYKKRKKPQMEKTKKKI